MNALLIYLYIFFFKKKLLFSRHTRHIYEQFFFVFIIIYIPLIIEEFSELDLKETDDDRGVLLSVPDSALIPDVPISSNPSKLNSDL